MFWRVMIGLYERSQQYPGRVLILLGLGGANESPGLRPGSFHYKKLFSSQWNSPGQVTGPSTNFLMAGRDWERVVFITRNSFQFNKIHAASGRVLIFSQLERAN